MTEAVIIDAKSKDFALNNVAVSNDGRFIAAVGTNNGGWIAVVDAAAKKIIWEKVPAGETDMLEVTFSPDGNRVYAGGRSPNVYSFDTKTAENVHTWIIGRSKLEVTQFAIHRSIVAIDISPDNRRVVATATDSRVYVWDADSGRAVYDWSPGQRSTVGSLAFSLTKPYIATAGIVILPKIKIWNTSVFMNK
jgi:WD40 repeat protein